MGNFKNNHMIYFVDKTKHFYSAFTETGATQTMKANQMAELKKQIPTFSNRANEMFGTKQ